MVGRADDGRRVRGQQPLDGPGERGWREQVLHHLQRDHGVEGPVAGGQIVVGRADLEAAASTLCRLAMAMPLTEVSTAVTW